VANRIRGFDSVFSRLVIVMLTMALSLLVFVGGFFWFLKGPSGGMTHRDLENAHLTLLILLLLVIGGVVLSAHTVLRRLLGPLRELNRGVERLGAGELDVALPVTTRDEFGTLTTGFNQMVGRVREMVTSRDQLLQDVSHELRSPLARMKVALELVPADQQPKGMAADIAEMERMIAELLELERLRTTGGVVLKRQDLVSIVRDVVEAFASIAPGVRIVAAPPSSSQGLKTQGPIYVALDADRFRAALRNVLDNAVKYSGSDTPPVEVEVRQSANSTDVRVRDYGPGIPEADRERVFEPFFRVDRSRTRATGGYGLGLSLCKRVMLAHGGTVFVEAPEGGGSVFVLRLVK
jgi:signal transduction histidine kinase